MRAPQLAMGKTRQFSSTLLTQEALRSWCRNSLLGDSEVLFEIAQAGHKEKLLQEQFGIQDCYVRSPPNQCVGRVGQGMEHIVTDQSAGLGPHNRLEQIVDHLCVDRTLEGLEKKITTTTTAS